MREIDAIIFKVLLFLFVCIPIKVPQQLDALYSKFQKIGPPIKISPQNTDVLLWHLT